MSAARVDHNTRNEAAIHALEQEQLGHVTCPSDGDYDTAHLDWNGMIDRRPALNVQCTGVEYGDVRLAFHDGRGQMLYAQMQTH